MAKQETITFLGKKYRGPRDQYGLGTFRRGKVEIRTWTVGLDDGGWQAGLDWEGVEIANQSGTVMLKTEAAALRDLETNVRKFLRALGVTL